MITTAVLLSRVCLWHSGKRVGAIVFTVLFLAIQAMFFIASMAKFLHGGWFTMLLTAAILFVMYTWNEGTKLERAQRRHMRPDDFLPALDKLHSDFRIPYFADNVVLPRPPTRRPSDSTRTSLLLASSPTTPGAPALGGQSAWKPPTSRSPAEYSVEDFGTNYRQTACASVLGFRSSADIHPGVRPPDHARPVQNRRDCLSRSRFTPQARRRSGHRPPSVTCSARKALMPESKVSARGALSLPRPKYAIRHMAGSPVKSFGLLHLPGPGWSRCRRILVSTRRPPRLKRTDTAKTIPTPTPTRAVADPAAVPDPMDTTSGLRRFVQEARCRRIGPRRGRPLRPLPPVLPARAGR